MMSETNDATTQRPTTDAPRYVVDKTIQSTLPSPRSTPSAKDGIPPAIVDLREVVEPMS